MHHCLVVHLRTRPETTGRFMDMLRENAIASRQEAGCRQFEVLVDPEDETRITLFEIYQDAAAFEAHQQTAHFKRYLAEAVPLLADRVRSFWRRAL
jgi:autoinducer 2-degrading protein